MGYGICKGVGSLRAPGKVEVMAIHKIEKHLYERANHTVREMYRVFRYENVQIYNEKTPSQLTKREKEAFKTVGKTVYHF